MDDEFEEKELPLDGDEILISGEDDTEEEGEEDPLSMGFHEVDSFDSEEKETF
ncbi:MAG: hypothetical protein WAV50_02700 [Minisyncoccia bacterium]